MPEHSHPPVDKKISVLIPAYNSSHTLLALTDQIKKQLPYCKILVVNDGSTDDTERIVHNSRAHIISHSSNKGKGAALRTGFRALKNSEWVICMDADLQHDASDLEQFKNAVFSDNFDLIIGFRNRLKSDMPLSRRISNWLTSRLLGLRLGCEIKDAQCGFRAVRLSSVEDADWIESGYMFETEFLIRAALNKRKIGWVPVKTIYNDSKSYIRPWVDTYKFVNLYFKSFNW